MRRSWSPWHTPKARPRGGSKTHQSIGLETLRFFGPLLHFWHFRSRVLRFSPLSSSFSFLTDLPRQEKLSNATHVRAHGARALNRLNQTVMRRQRQRCWSC